MILDKNVRHTDEEILSYSSSLFQIALCAHVASPDASKRSLLFLYLYGWRFISRRQIYNLLSYDSSNSRDVKNAEEFIGRLVRSELIRKSSTETGVSENSVFSITKKGLDVGRRYYKEEVARILDKSNVFYSPYVMTLLLGERDNLDEYIHRFEEYSTERYKNKLRSTIHRLSTMDSYISFLLHLQPASIAWYGTEVSFSRGETVANEYSNLLSNTTDVRSDALFHLSLRRSGRIASINGTENQIVCIEQDTSHQSAVVLQDKIERYVHLIALPRIKKYEIPPTLVFTVIPANRAQKKKARTEVRESDSKFIKDIERFAILYCAHKGIGPEQVSLSDFIPEFETFCGNHSLFQKHMSYMKDNMGVLGAQLPMSELVFRHQELLSKDTAMDCHRNKAYTSYCNRKSTIFSAAAQVPGMEQAARTGFSVCSTSNYEPTALLSLFPELSRGRDLLSLVLSGTSTTGMSAEFIPFHKYRCRNGVEITFRNAYRIGQEVYIMENISEDYCGRLRLDALLENEPVPHIHFLAVFPLEEYVSITKELSSAATERQRDCLYGCAYRSTEGGDIQYINPIQISKLTS